MGIIVLWAVYCGTNKTYYHYQNNALFLRKEVVQNMINNIGAIHVNNTELAPDPIYGVFKHLHVKIRYSNNTTEEFYIREWESLRITDKLPNNPVQPVSQGDSRCNKAT